MCVKYLLLKKQFNIIIKFNFFLTIYNNIYFKF